MKNLLHFIIENYKTILFFLGIGILTVVVLILFFSNSNIEFKSFQIIPDSKSGKPKYFIQISSFAKNEFVVGQPVKIVARLMFPTKNDYDEFMTRNTIGAEEIHFLNGNTPLSQTESIIIKTGKKEGKLVIIISGASPLNEKKLYLNENILLSETEIPLIDDLKATFISDKYLIGETSVLFHQAGNYELYTFSNGKKAHITNITISPRSIGAEFRRNKTNILLTVIGIILAFISLFLKIKS